MTVSHAIHEPWRSHIQQTLQTVAKLEAQAQAYRQHLSLLITPLAKEAGLPESKYHLSPDGASLIGELPDETNRTITDSSASDGSGPNAGTANSAAA